MSNAYEGDSTAQNIPGIYGVNNLGGDGVFGSGTSGGRGTVGVSDTGIGVCGNSTSGTAVWGGTNSKTSPAVSGYCDGGADGVFGNAVGGGRGTVGVSDAHTGVEGDSTSGVGVWGQSQTAEGVHGLSTSGVGVWGESQSGEGVHGISHGASTAGVAGYNDKGGPAGLFQGNVEVNGTLAVSQNVQVSGTLAVAQDITLTGADCAEDFDLVFGVSSEPGSVMVIDSSGSLAPCTQAYDRRVAGVVSGAGAFRPAFTLDRRASSSVPRSTIALVGKVYCMAIGPVAVGDLLTTSSTSGHAMKAEDLSRGAGAILGKAIGRLERGSGLVPMLVTLQ